ncbi:hypothetical protein EI42_05281 [Thermosporothrix hazakensis]|uniref:Uncharacterized protein n=1 Tax=Thermosporothrix hazakensis TaxID=644383 RepID=A0A326TZ37_THEHA|nr:hypothetical protein EI42_05281 [Thermosporothrix hazakensis]
MEQHASLFFSWAAMCCSLPRFSGKRWRSGSWTMDSVFGEVREIGSEATVVVLSWDIGLLAFFRGTQCRKISFFLGTGMIYIRL